MNSFALVVLFAGLGVLPLSGQSHPLRPAANGPEPLKQRFVALVGATLHRADGTVIPDATVVIDAGRIAMVGEGLLPPEGAEAIDLRGRHLWPGLIEIGLEVPVAELPPTRPGAYQVASVTPDRQTRPTEEALKGPAKTLRGLGFTVAAAVPSEGSFRGQAIVLSLAPEASADARVIYREGGPQFIDFVRGRSYPGSEMGNIALIRQVFSDAEWTRRQPTPEVSALLAIDAEAAGEDGVHLLFDTDNELQLLRIAALQAEFGLKGALIRGSGRELRRLEAVVRALQAGEHTLLLPLNFPAAPKIEREEDLQALELETLQFFEQAKTNPRRLHEAGISLALTADGRRGPDSAFRTHLAQAIAAGLPESAALAMLTRRPAELLGLERELGDVQVGMRAHLVVTDGSLFAEKTKILSLWIDGVEADRAAPKDEEFRGQYRLQFGETLSLSAEFKSAKALVVKRGEEVLKTSAVRVSDGRFEFQIDFGESGPKGRWLCAGSLPLTEGEPLLGSGQSLAGERLPLRLEPDDSPLSETPKIAANKDGTDALPAEKTEAKEETEQALAEEPLVRPLPPLPGYPFGPYALKQYPDQEALIITGATLWTSGPRGKIHPGALVAEAGIIRFVGTLSEFEAWRAANALSGDVRTIDATGKHLTPGLIDAHSHTGISGGVNEGGQAVTAEVRIQDVTDPDDISWYRQLAGGVTCVNAMHGSANPIGGQTQTVKVRWGVAHPTEMHFLGAKPGIKFALGENVKRARSGGGQARYPATRMGVQVLIADRFRAARDYVRARALRGEAVRRDYELEALVEILEGKRWIHCHSYRQDEILMLCELAKREGFRIGTFQHVLEGYKVAPEIAEVAVGASAFSDWWAYKIEVQDAIPWAGAIMHEAGVNVSFNSDSDELARRMNVEAAKAVRYGGLDEDVALHFVTINPARQLGIADRVGSLEVGKHADLALWTTSPLSTRARCAATWVDGRPLFSFEQDLAHREFIAAERARLIALVLQEKSKGSSDKTPKESDAPGEESRARGSLAWEARARAEHLLQLWRLGFDPMAGRCGECDRLGH